MMCKHDELNVARMKEMLLDDKDDKRRERNSSRNSTQRREKFPRQGGNWRDGYQTRSYSHASVQKCSPDKCQTCHQCNGRDHFNRCCRSRKPSVTTRKKVYVVDEHDFVVDSADESNNNDSWIVPLLVHNVMIPMKLDTGSDVNILPLADFNSLQNIPNLRQTQVKLTAYNGEDILVKGQAVLYLKHRGHTQRALFVIMYVQDKCSLS